MADSTNMSRFRSAENESRAQHIELSLEQARPDIISIYSGELIELVQDCIRYLPARRLSFGTMLKTAKKYQLQNYTELRKAPYHEPSIKGMWTERFRNTKVKYFLARGRDLSNAVEHFEKSSKIPNRKKVTVPDPPSEDQYDSDDELGLAVLEVRDLE